LENPLPAALSPSRLQDFQSCPRKFQHAAVDRIPQPATYATLKGTFVHHVLEGLFKMPGPERTAEFAKGLIDEAEAEVLTDRAVADVGLDDAGRERLRDETRQMIDRYVQMEDPSTVNTEGVELRIRHEVDGVPMMGILDRLDREKDGSLSIVDYKTGALPNRDFDSKTFANTELYAALCEDELGELPKRIRLLYVAHGQEIERTVTAPVVAARRKSAASAWTRITAYYATGEFPATPSRSSCRFCAFTAICRANGVKVAV
jgi:putative RecB family exonuclease